MGHVGCSPNSATHEQVISGALFKLNLSFLTLKKKRDGGGDNDEKDEGGSNATTHLMKCEENQTG